MQTSKLSTETILPLTCTRSGTCCFGKAVMLNPWELLMFSKEKNITPKAFRDLYCDFGGIQLRFNGKKDSKGQNSCSQYVQNFGCSVHNGRPLACRLYPLGRQIQNNKAEYIYEGDQFPCLTDCAKVLELPQMSVGEYLKGQEAAKFESAQNEYLQIMQNIADIAFELLLDTGLSESGDTRTLGMWRKMGDESSEQIAIRIGEKWLNYLMLPEITENTEDPVHFSKQHNELLLNHIQAEFGVSNSLEAFHQGSVILMGLALHLAKGVGANQQSMAAHWIETAKKFGAREEL